MGLHCWAEGRTGKGDWEENQMAEAEAEVGQVLFSPKLVRPPFQRFFYKNPVGHSWKTVPPATREYYWQEFQHFTWQPYLKTQIHRSKSYNNIWRSSGQQHQQVAALEEQLLAIEAQQVAMEWQMQEQMHKQMEDMQHHIAEMARSGQLAPSQDPPSSASHSNH
ncbi:conserved hypothetical protein [Ricinus communis]|uniref:Uncharacterized protein n=1 Tax=Ricinus communis TaxID=3988 RepID=B9RHI6_RICCO|nr:conserved hypothetical protein [Ricinus communis]